MLIYNNFWVKTLEVELDFQKSCISDHETHKCILKPNLDWFDKVK